MQARKLVPFAVSPFQFEPAALGFELGPPEGRQRQLNLEEFPSGQRGQTVNLLRFASVVRIHPRPPKLNQIALLSGLIFLS